MQNKNETKGQLILDEKIAVASLDNYNPYVNIQVPSLSLKKMDRKFKEFLRNKSKIIKNKNKFKACLSS